MFEKNSKQTTFLPGLSFYYLLTTLPVISKMPVSNVAAMMMTSVMTAMMAAVMAAVVMAMPRLS